MARNTLAESVADALRHAIFQGAYLSGERLVELTVAQEMNVSQNTVRDALRLLEQDGLVIKRPRHGTHIRSYTANEILELYALWSAVETLALEWALSRVTADQLADLEQLVNRMRTSILADRERESLEIRFELHSTLVEIAGRPQTRRILQRLHNQVRLLENLRQAQTLHSLEHRDTQINQCQALVDAIRDNDLERAQVHLCTCIEVDCKAVMAVLG